AGVLVRLNTSNRSPSKRTSPSSVPSHTYPSRVCSIVCTEFCGRPALASHTVRVHWAIGLSGLRPAVTGNVEQARQRRTRSVVQAHPTMQRRERTRPDRAMVNLIHLDEHHTLECTLESDQHRSDQDRRLHSRCAGSDTRDGRYLSSCF